MAAKVLRLHEDDDLELKEASIIDFRAWDLRVGDELVKTHRLGATRVFRIRGFRPGKRPHHVRNHNTRVHPNDNLILTEIATGATYEVGVAYCELSARWGHRRR